MPVKKKIDTKLFTEAVVAKHKERQHGKDKSIGRDVAEVAQLVAVQSKEDIPVLDDKEIKEINDNSQQYLVVRDYIIDAFRRGIIDSNIAKSLVKAGYKYKSAQEIIRRVARELNDTIEAKKVELVNHNIGILQNVIEQTMEDRDFRTSLLAIGELNRVLHAYDQKVEVKIENNFGFDFGMPSSQNIEVSGQEIEDIDADDAED